MIVPLKDECINTKHINRSGVQIVIPVCDSVIIRWGSPSLLPVVGVYVPVQRYWVVVISPLLVHVPAPRVEVVVVSLPLVQQQQA